MPRRDYEVVVADEIEALPLRARVALAARCARRSGPWVGAWGNSEAMLLVDAVEAYAAARPVDLASEALTNAREVALKRAQFEGDTEIYAPEHTGYAIVAAFDAARAHQSTEITANVVRAVNEAGFGIRRFVGLKLQYHEREEIRRDFELLVRVSERERWNDDTPVRPEFFSPEAILERHILLAVNDLCVKLCELIAADARALSFIEWREVERVVAMAFKGLGFEVELTRPAKDGGKDIIARCELRGDIHVYYVEVKHWRSGKKAGPREVNHFVEINVRDHTKGGLFLSTSGYAPAVYVRLAEIGQRRIQLGNSETVVSLCQQFVRHQGSAVWQVVDILPEVVFKQLTQSPPLKTMQ